MRRAAGGLVARKSVNSSPNESYQNDTRENGEKKKLKEKFHLDKYQ